VRRSFKYRLYPNQNQERELGIMLETLRRLYNTCLEQRKTAWETEQRTVKAGEQSKWFTQERKTNPWLARLTFNSGHAVIMRLDKAYQAFFRRIKSKTGKAGYPRFKGRDRFHSIEFECHGKGNKLKGDRLYVQHVGDVKVKLHRPIQGAIKTVTLKREAEKWYVVFSCDLGDVAVPESMNPPVGIDVGIESFLTTSDGEHFPNPAHLKAALPELRRRARAVARKKRSGKNRRKAVKRLAKAHARVKNLRKEHHHQTALNLVRRYGLVAVESLNIQGMVRNHRIARAISDAAWGGFLSTLRYKAESAGVAFVEVDARGTSQLCSECGTEVRKDLSIRTHRCSCGLVLHRDHNAARNILARGATGWIAPAGLNSGVGLDAPGSQSLLQFMDI
jgi:putative transposase